MVVVVMLVLAVGVVLLLLLMLVGKEEGLQDVGWESRGGEVQRECGWGRACGERRRKVSGLSEE